MLFGTLIQRIPIQGNVRLSVWDDEEEINVQYVNGTENLLNEPVRLLAYHKVRYIFAGNDGYLHIELEK